MWDILLYVLAGLGVISTILLIWMLGIFAAFIEGFWKR